MSCRSLTNRSNDYFLVGLALEMSLAPHPVRQAFQQFPQLDALAKPLASAGGGFARASFLLFFFAMQNQIIFARVIAEEAIAGVGESYLWRLRVWRKC